MKILLGERRSGKTTELVKIAAQSKAVIVCFNQQMVQCTKDRAKQLGLEIETPITFSKLQKGYLMGTNHKVLIDDFDLVLRSIISGYHNDVEAIAMSNEEIQLLSTKVVPGIEGY